jgi:hypothetical protein
MCWNRLGIEELIPFEMCNDYQYDRQDQGKYMEWINPCQPGADIFIKGFCFDSMFEKFTVHMIDYEPAHDKKQIHHQITFAEKAADIAWEK